MSYTGLGQHIVHKSGKDEVWVWPAGMPCGPVEKDDGGIQVNTCAPGSTCCDSGYGVRLCLTPAACAQAGGKPLPEWECASPTRSWPRPRPRTRPCPSRGN
jgi:hypothetical protein